MKRIFFLFCECFCLACFCLFLLVCCSHHNPQEKISEPEEVQEIDIRSPFQNLKIYRENNLWRGQFLPLQNSESPANTVWRSYLFDPDEVENLISTFSKIPETKNNLSTTDIQLTFKFPHSNKQWNISKENPLRRDVLKPSTLWRNRKILDEDISRMTEIILLHHKQSITLLHNDEQIWIWKENPKQTINQEWVNSLARKLSRLKAMSTGELVSKKEAGLLMPEYEALVKIRGKTDPIRVLLGKIKSEDLYYALVEGLADWKNDIITVNQETAEKIKTNFSNLLKKE